MIASSTARALRSSTAEETTARSILMKSTGSARSISRPALPAPTSSSASMKPSARSRAASGISTSLRASVRSVISSTTCAGSKPAPRTASTRLSPASASCSSVCGETLRNSSAPFGSSPASAQRRAAADRVELVAAADRVGDLERLAGPGELVRARPRERLVAEHARAAEVPDRLELDVDGAGVDQRAHRAHLLDRDDRARCRRPRRRRRSCCRRGAWPRAARRRRDPTACSARGPRARPR